jgi:dTDP-4-dehydrorhamnose 3,5-epimerase
MLTIISTDRATEMSEPGLDVRHAAIADLLIIATRWFADDRGAFSETYQQQRFNLAGVTISFMQDNQATSKRAGTVRGLHFQRPPAAQNKLIRVVRGAIFDVAVDVRPGSPSYGRWAGLELSATNRLQFFVPAGFAHGYLTLEDDTDVLYKVDAPYRPACEGGLRWDDPAVGIAWPPTAGPIVTAPRDAQLPLLSELAPIESWRIGTPP